MDIEEALLIVDAVLESIFLSDLQELVLRQSWEGKTYPEIAESYGYEANYIKNVGYKLWTLLSQAFAEEVTKSNFRSAIRRQSTHVLAKRSHSISEANNNSKNTQILTDTLNNIKFPNPDDNSMLNQHLVAISIVKQCMECPLIELFKPSKNGQEFKIESQVNLVRLAGETDSASAKHQSQTMNQLSTKC